MNAAATNKRAAIPRSRSLPTFFDNLDSFAEAPEGVAKLRAFVLDLAVRGKLVEQDENDEPASELVDAIAREKARLVKAKEIKKPQSLPPIASGAASTEVPTGWALTLLGNLVFDFQNGLSKRRSAVGEPVPVLRLADIKSGEISSRELREIQLTDDELAHYPLAKGDVLIIRVNGSADLVGRFIPCREGKRWTYCDHFIRMRVPTAYVDQRFLCILANSRWGREHVNNNTVTTAGQKTINQTGVGTLPVLLPPLSEQRRIVAKVDGLMALCDELEARGSERVRVRERASRSCLARLVNSRSRRDLASAWQRLSDHFEVLYDTPETLAHLRQSILQLAVQGKLVPQDPNDEPAVELLKRVAAKREQLLSECKLPKRANLNLDDNGDPLFDAPTGWTWTHFDEIADIASGVTKGRKLHGRKTAWYPYLRVANVQRWRLDLKVMKDIEIPIEEVAKYRLQNGDLVLTEGGDWDKLGRTAVWQGEIKDCLHQNHVFRARVLDSDIERRWVMLFTNSPVGRDYFENASKKTTNLASINMTQLRRCPIPLPPIAEQKRIVAKVDQLMSQCDELSARLRERRSAGQTLLASLVHHLLNQAEP
jgi:type I restriction enzyme S subunit